jgi:hypothetical protein
MATLSCPCMGCGHKRISRTQHFVHRKALLGGQRLYAPDIAYHSSEDGGSQQSGGDDSEDEGDPTPIRRTPRLFDGFCLDLIDLVARGQVNATGMENVITLLNRHISHQLDENAHNCMPSSWHDTKKRGRQASGIGRGSIHFYRHFCEDCGEIFPVDEYYTLCPTRLCKGTRFERPGVPFVKALYYDLSDKFARLLADGFLRGLLLTDAPAAARRRVADRELLDVHDGTIISDLRKAYPGKTIIFVSQVHAHAAHTIAHQRPALGMKAP